MRGALLSLVIFLCVVFAAIMADAVIDRDSLVYRAVSKLVFPVSKQLAGISDGVLERPFKSEFTEELDGWRWARPDYFRHAFTADGLMFESVTESVWWMNKRGMAYRHIVEGDVDVIASVATCKASDPGSYPDKDYQFAGIMLRDPRGDALFSTENYVFNVVGYRGERLQVETKSTSGGYSEVHGHDWPTGDAQLRISRKGQQLALYARQSVEDNWIALEQFDRADLPEKLELGLIAYAFSHGDGRHDLCAKFMRLDVE